MSDWVLAKEHHDTHVKSPCQHPANIGFSFGRVMVCIRRNNHTLSRSTEVVLSRSKRVSPGLGGWKTRVGVRIQDR